MEDKQKQIEKMANIMFEKAFENYETSGSVEIDTEVRRKCYSAYLTYCETIYNAGYRKIPENAVVVSRAEYNDLKGLEKHFDDYLIKEIVETRKETAEEFARKAKEQFSDSARLCEQIDGIAKEFTEGKV